MHTIIISCSHAGVESSAAWFESHFSVTSRLNYSAIGTTRGVVRNHLLLGSTADNSLHDCKKRLNKNFKTSSTKYESDIVYIFDFDNQTHVMYKLLEQPNDDGLVKCKKIKTTPFVDPFFDICLGPFGLYVSEYMDGPAVNLNFDTFDGRVVTRNLLCKNMERKPVLITLPNFWLFSYK